MTRVQGFSQRPQQLLLRRPAPPHCRDAPRRSLPARARQETHARLLRMPERTLARPQACADAAVHVDWLHAGRRCAPCRGRVCPPGPPPDPAPAGPAPAGAAGAAPPAAKRGGKAGAPKPPRKPQRGGGGDEAEGDAGKGPLPPEPPEPTEYAKNRPRREVRAPERVQSVAACVHLRRREHQRRGAVSARVKAQARALGTHASSAECWADEPRP